MKLTPAVKHRHSLFAHFILTISFCAFSSLSVIAEQSNEAWETAKLSGFKKMNGLYYAEAIPHFEKARAIAVDKFEEDDLRIPEILMWISKAQMGLKKYDTAHARVSEAISLIEQHYGATHPALADPVEVLGSVAWKQGGFSAAEPYFRRVITLRENDPAIGVWKLSHAYDRLGEVLRYKKEFPESVELYKKAIDITLRDWNNVEERLLLSTRWVTQNRASSAFKDAGEYELAVHALTEALKYEEQIRGHQSSGTRFNLCEVVALSGNTGQAISLLEALLSELDERMLKHDLNYVELQDRERAHKLLSGLREEVNKELARHEKERFPKHEDLELPDEELAEPSWLQDILNYLKQLFQYVKSQ